LLRVLQEREVEWVGGRRPVPVDIRLVAATNKDLKEEIRQNRFRQDLYFRLNVITLDIPPLRERRGDILPLCKYFLNKYRHQYGGSTQALPKEFLEAYI